ncbi:MAG: 50S ribosomal protein L18 [Candidatus Blackburnbacteria bacterium]|nr:50S ribosomal protein L18 [Candidatus Blackburnbacteria bacterium]
MYQKYQKTNSRAKRNRAKLELARTDRPRLSVFISNSHVYGQIIDDKKGVTLVSANDKEIEKNGGKNIEIAQKVGELLGQKAKDKKINKVVFDRGARRYHGRVKALAEGARKELSF